MTRSSQTHQEKAQLSGFYHRRLIIHNNYGEKLLGILHETGSKEIVIVCHGFQSSKDCIPMVTIAAALERNGISACRFDFAGNGESEGSSQYGNYHREAEDLRAVVQFFQSEERAITAIIGHSKGGNVVLLYASKYNDIFTVVNISGRFHLERGIEGRLGEGYLQRIKQSGFIVVKNRKACLTIHLDCRVLTVHGSMDTIVPVDDALEFDKFIPNHKLHIVEGADHDYTSHQNELAAAVLDFLRVNGQDSNMPRAVNIINSKL